MVDRSPPPGPRGLPVLGCALDFRRDPLGFFTLLARRWGDVAAFRLGVLRCCLVNRPDLIEALLVERDPRMLKPWDERQLAVALGQGLLTGSGERWRRQRRLVEPAFRGERLRGYAGSMDRIAGETAERWPPSAEIDVHAEVQRITLAIVAETLFGADLTPRAEEAAHAFGVLTDRFESLLTGWLPIPLAARTPGNARLHRAVGRLQGIAAEIVQARRRAAGGDDLLSVLVEARDPGDRGLQDRELQEIVITLLAAGHETTALAIAWALHLVGAHPEVDARLAEEARQVSGGSTTGRLPFARAVVRESLRLYPPAWGIGRETTRVIELGGFRIQPGTQVYVVPWVTHRDPRWFPQPERFDPDRWADGAPAESARAWVPFGAGPRGCVGSGFAMIEAPLVLSALVRRWRFVPVPGHPIELQPAITLRPRHGIRMRIERRA
ncbi:MAG TPA: cytochrome P450 [Gemmatimonadota bacterium]|nr:cytochrome P450 [Gemmatimonadota bacterium]